MDLSALKALNAELEAIEQGKLPAPAALSFDYSKLKMSSSTTKKSNSTSVSSLAWSALVSLSHLPRIPDNGARIAVKLIELLEAVLQTTKDLEKLIANVSVKLFAHPLEFHSSEELIEFLGKSFERIQVAASASNRAHDADGLAGDIGRRLSLQLALIEGIQFNFPMTSASRDLKQCYAIALDGLLKVVLMKREPCACLDELIDLFLFTSTGALMKLISWCSKLESPVTRNEWRLWCRVVGTADDWRTAAHFYRKRVILEYWKGPIELIAPLKHLPLQAELIEETSEPCKCTALASLIERFEGETLLVVELIQKHSWCQASLVELKELLKPLDLLRCRFSRLVKVDDALSLLNAINRALKQIVLPAKYSSAWGTRLLRALVEAKRTQPIRQCTASAIDLLLTCALTEAEFKEKSLKAAAQAAALASDAGLLERILAEDHGLLSVVLDHFVEGVSAEFIDSVSLRVTNRRSSTQNLKAWVRVLSLQSTIHPLPSNLPFAAMKAICAYMLDDLKADRYLEGACAGLEERERLFVLSYLAAVNTRRRKPVTSESWPILEAIKNNCKLESISSIQSDAQLDAHFHYLQQCLKRPGFMDELTTLKEANSAFIPVYRLFSELICSPEHDENIAAIHRIYLSGDNKAALKRGYEIIKHLLQTLFAFLPCCVYLHRLACVSGAQSEASWFLKQVTQLADGSETVCQLIDALKRDFDVLCSRDNCFDQVAIEEVLESERFALFSRELAILDELKQSRRALPKLTYFCSGITKADCARIDAKEETRFALDYFNVEWAKIELHRTACSASNDHGHLFKLFHRALGYPFSLSRLAGSTLGILCDWATGGIWILSTCSSSEPFLLFRIPIDKQSFLLSIKECARISQANTETLKNTLEIANDPALRADWWKRRKGLDVQLAELIKSLDLLIFSDFSGFFLPSSSQSQVKASNLAQELKSRAQLEISLGLAEKLVNLGSFPKRAAVELFLKMAGRPCTDESISVIRKCFENALELGSIFYDSTEADNVHSLNLLLDKTLCTLPWESFPSLRDRTSFRRVLIDSAPEKSLESVFYIINPSGDLVKTQERFKALFESKQNWKGIVGRRPSSDEFFKGIGGDFDLFIYFGHAGGEIYAPLHELSRQKRKEHASAALLVGCSSGRIKINGIFSPQSSVFHYLENDSPLVLAALWDVTDKDIDTYIKQVLDKSGLLQHNQATLRDINEQAHSSRSICYLRALNGFAPIVYGPYIK